MRPAHYSARGMNVHSCGAFVELPRQTRTVQLTQLQSNSTHIRTITVGVLFRISYRRNLKERAGAITPPVLQHASRATHSAARDSATKRIGVTDSVIRTGQVPRDRNVRLTLAKCLNQRLAWTAFWRMDASPLRRTFKLDFRPQ